MSYLILLCFLTKDCLFLILFKSHFYNFSQQDHIESLSLQLYVHSDIIKMQTWSFCSLERKHFSTFSLFLSLPLLTRPTRMCTVCPCFKFYLLSVSCLICYTLTVLTFLYVFQWLFLIHLLFPPPQPSPLLHPFHLSFLPASLSLYSLISKI